MALTRSALLPRLAIFSVILASLSGCSILRGDGTKQRLDTPREIPHHPVNTKPRTMRVEVTTDATGAVTTIEFKRSSGSAAVDGFVENNIRHTWPAKPSDRSLVELTYSAEKGFSEPTLISSTPAP